jgi:hypothetical protein
MRWIPLFAVALGGGTGREPTGGGGVASPTADEDPSCSGAEVGVEACGPNAAESCCAVPGESGSGWRPQPGLPMSPPP